MPLRLLIGLLLLIIFPARAQAFGDCTNAEYLAAFNVTGRVASCQSRDLDPLQFNGQTRSVRIFRLHRPWHGDDEQWIGDINATLAQISFALEALGPGLDVKDISIHLSDHIGRGTDRGAHAATGFGTGLTAECPIVVYKTASRTSTEGFARVLAHEIFHCAQEDTWPAKASETSALWWVEGSAEYFAQLVVPGNPGSQGFITQFSSTSPDTSLYAAPMDYENVVFFDWLHSRGGGDAVVRFLNSVPNTDDPLPFLQRTVPTADWVDFIETYALHRLTAPDGQVINAGPPSRYMLVEGESGDSSLGTDAYRSLLVEARFPEQGRYEITIDGGDGLQAKISRGGGAWQDLPLTIDACTDQSPIVLYAVTTGEPEYFTLNYRRVEPCSSCEVARQIDRCLIGPWTLTGGGPVEWMRANGMGDMARVETSEMTIRMTRDGRYVTAPIDVLVEAENDGVAVTGTGVGTDATGTWSAGDGILNICPQTAHITTTVTAGGGPMMQQVFGAGPEMQMSYTCAGNTLSTLLEIGSGLPPMSFTYTRARP